MNNFAMGRYVPYDSFIHRMDPRIKIVSVILLMVCIFIPYVNYSMTFLMAGIALVLIFVALGFTHTSPLRFLKSLLSLWFTALFLLIVYIVLPKSGDVSSLHVAFSINGYGIYWESFLDAGKILTRLMLMIALTMLLTATTTPLELTYAFEWFMLPLKAIGFPAAEVSMTLSIALRFIPTILEDVNRIMKAQSSRGVDFKHGHLGQKFRSIISLIVPLFVSSFMRSEELANAMECRCYDPKAKRTKYRKLRIKAGDIFSFIFVILIATAFIYVSASSFDAFSAWFHMEVW